MSRRARATGPSSAVVDLCLERAQYSCEIHGGMVGDRRGLDWSLHHRLPRRMGGTRAGWINLPSNLLVVCGSGTSGCHGLIERYRLASRAAGWLLRSGLLPGQERVRVFDPEKHPNGSRWVLLDDEGGYVDVPAPAGVR